MNAEAALGTARESRRVQMCRFCAHMTCGDANWCAELEDTLGDDAMSAENDCGGYEYNPIDAITLKQCYPAVVARKRRAARERVLYERRMRGDWS